MRGALRALHFHKKEKGRKRGPVNGEAVRRSNAAFRVPCPLPGVALETIESPCKPRHARKGVRLHPGKRGAVCFRATVRPAVTARARGDKPATRGGGAEINRQPTKRGCVKRAEARQT